MAFGKDPLAEEPSKPSKEASQFEVQIEALEKQLVEAKEEAAKNLDKALRATAELENTRRRADRDVENAHKFSIERFAKALVPVMDSLEKALEVKSDQPEIKATQAGVEMTLKLFADTLTKFGMDILDPTGHPFDPHHHEAMSAVEHPSLSPGMVVSVYQKGYRLNGRVVRPARVVVVRSLDQ